MQWLTTSVTKPGVSTSSLLIPQSIEDDPDGKQQSAKAMVPMASAASSSKGAASSGSAKATAKAKAADPKAAKREMMENNLKAKRRKLGQ